MELRRYWTTACHAFPLKSKCTTGPERRIPRWEHEHWKGKKPDGVKEVIRSETDFNLALRTKSPVQNSSPPASFNICERSSGIGGPPYDRNLS